MIKTFPYYEIFSVFKLSSPFNCKNRHQFDFKKYLDIWDYNEKLYWKRSRLCETLQFNVAERLCHEIFIMKILSWFIMIKGDLSWKKLKIPLNKYLLEWLKIIEREHLELSYIVSRNAKWYSHLEKRFQDFYKVKFTLTLWPSCLPLSI